MMTVQTPPPEHIKYRPDIDGLRAIAVLSVVAFHAFPDWIAGGFIGVDVFFVISGFLISTIIFENLDRGSFSFADFYARRIKRIFPALLLVLVCSYIFGWLALFADEFTQLGKHIAAGGGFISNIVLWSEAGYFDNTADTKPLLHLWSLGIEEQFYIVWPLFLWLMMKTNISLLKVTIVLALLSFALNVLSVKSDPVGAFYLPQTRFWELMFGSILAWIMLCYRNSHSGVAAKIGAWLSRNSKSTNVLSVIGFGMLAVGFWTISEEVHFPGFWAILPVLGTALLISTGPRTFFNRTILSNRAAVWFGLISYPLYLWHWPLLSFARIVEGETPSAGVRCAAVALSILLAWLTYSFVEKPIRNRGNSTAKVAALVFLMLTTTAVGFYTYMQDGFAFRFAQYETNIQQFTAPTFRNRNHCPETFAMDRGHCVISSNQDSYDSLGVLLVGDSHGEALGKGLALEKDIAYLSLGPFGCLPLKNVERFSELGAHNCQEVVAPIMEGIEEHDFSRATLLLVARHAAYVEGSGYGEIDTKSRGEDNIHIQRPGPRLEAEPGLYRQVFIEALRDTLDLVAPRFENVVIVQQVPELGFDPRACISRPFRVSSARCTLSRAQVLGRQAQYREALDEVLGPYTNVKIYDPLEVFCDSKNCYAVRNDQVLYRDNNHLSFKGARAVIQDMREKGYF